MILTKSVTAVVVFMIWIDGNFGASYSKVFVNSGSNDGSYEYAAYGAPVVAYSAPIVQDAPVGSVLPYPRAARFVTPCVSPCVPQQPTQLTNAGLVAYTAPRAPVVVARDVPSNYEYSYFVYDDGTGDQKAARELSDAGVVQGQYSFLQPDGYVREVQYTADDLTGFNAVVNYVPGSGNKAVDSKEAKPCPDPKPEALKVSEVPIEEKPKSQETADVIQTKSDKMPPASGEKSNKIIAFTPDAPAAKSAAPAILVVQTSASQVGASKENKPAEEQGKVEVVTPKQLIEETKPDDNKLPDPLGEIVSAEVKEVQPPAEGTASEIPKSAPTIETNTQPLGYVSYDQLLKCIKKMQNSDLRANSPLTYILLPSNYKPC